MPRLVLKNVSEEKLRALKAEAARRGITLSQAVEEAIDLWLRSSGGIVTDEAGDDMVWLENREKLLREHRGRYAVIAEGRLIGVYETLEEVQGVLRGLRGRGVKRAIVVRIGVDEEGWVGEWLGGSMERVA